MIDISTFDEMFLWEANKSQAGSLPTPKEKNHIYRSALYEWFNRRYSPHHQYKPGRPVPTVGYEANQSISDDLRNYETQGSLKVEGGKVMLPDGDTVKDRKTSKVLPAYLHLSSLLVTVTYKVGEGYETKDEYVDILKDDEVSTRLSSQVDPVSSSSPIGTIRSDHIELWPKDKIQYVKMVYLRELTVPKWAYQMNDNGRPEFDKSNSVDIDAPKDAENEIREIALSYLSTHMRDEQLKKYSERNKQQSV